MEPKRIVVIGGGTGTAVVLSALKQLSQVEITAIVSVADSGGSTGRLRDEFGFAPVGDLRQALASLAHPKDQVWIKDLLLYRFNKGKGLEGHNLGNLILTALQDMTGSTAKAIEIASSIFRLKGQVLPSTTATIDLVIEYEDGTFIIGEHHLNPDHSGGKKIRRVRLSPHATLYSKAKASLLAADLIIIGPGDLYASILPNLIVKSMRSTLLATKAPVVYLVNLMTSFTQTHGYTAKDHVGVIEAAIHRPLTKIIVNSAKIPPAIVRAYQKFHDSPVVFNLESDPRVIFAPLITTAQVPAQAGDVIPRSFLRHDATALAHIFKKII